LSYLLIFNREFQTLDSMLTNQDQTLIVGLQNFSDPCPVCLGVQAKAVALIAADHEGPGQSGQDDATIMQADTIVKRGLGSGINRQPGVPGIL
jgi:hypothetical protein